jgi:Zn-dependent protease
MNQQVVIIIFEVVVLAFAFSLHEAAHAWMASRCGDQTARMLGRVTLNPAKHLDPIGSVVMPGLALLYHWPVFGWAKPTPVTPRNFRNYKRDDILVILAGPASNLLAATAALVLMLVLKHTSGIGEESLVTAIQLAFGQTGISTEGLPQLFPIALLLYFVILINLSLFIFNLLPFPPLDGSRILRHFLPYKMGQMYDRIGMFGLVLMFLVGGRMVGWALDPALNTFNSILLSM